MPSPFDSRIARYWIEQPAVGRASSDPPDAGGTLCCPVTVGNASTSASQAIRISLWMMDCGALAAKRKPKGVRAFQVATVAAEDARCHVASMFTARNLLAYTRRYSLAGS